MASAILRSTSVKSAGILVGGLLADNKQQFPPRVPQALLLIEQPSELEAPARQAGFLG
jgi:hypothetical protein